MSRSRRHTPICAYTCCESNKKFKIYEHQRERATVKKSLIVALRKGTEEEYLGPHPKKYGNEWASPRDGKGYFGEMKYRPCPYISRIYKMNMCEGRGGHYNCRVYYKQLMRK